LLLLLGQCVGTLKMMESVRYEMNRYPSRPLPLLPRLMVDPAAIKNVLQQESLTKFNPLPWVSTSNVTNQTTIRMV